MEISAAEFKAKCLKLMDEVAKTRESITITKRGKPIAKLVPIESETRSLFGYMKGTVTILGDIVSPINEKWSAIAGDEDEFWVFGNYRGTPQHLVFSLMCEGFITFQVQPDPPKQVAQIFNPISAALERLDFIVQSFDPAAR